VSHLSKRRVQSLRLPAALIPLFCLTGCSRSPKPEPEFVPPPPTPAAVCMDEARQKMKQAQTAADAKETAQALALALQAREKLAEGRRLAQPAEGPEFDQVTEKLQRLIAELEDVKRRAEGEEQRRKEAEARAKVAGELNVGTSPAELERQKQADEEARRKKAQEAIDKLTQFNPPTTAAAGKMDDSDPVAAWDKTKKKDTPPTKPAATPRPPKKRK